MRKGVLRNFAKFIGKHLCQSLFFNKVAGLRRALVKVIIKSCKKLLESLTVIFVILNHII